MLIHSRQIHLAIPDSHLVSGRQCACFHCSPQTARSNKTLWSRESGSTQQMDEPGHSELSYGRSLTIKRTHELLPCGLQWRKLVKLFRKAKIEVLLV